MSNLEPGDFPGVAHAPIMSVPLDALQHVGRPSSPSSDPPGVTPFSAVTAPPLAAVAATALPSPALLERLTPEPRASFLCVWERLRHIVARLLSTFTAQAGPLSQSNSWVIFFVVLLTFFPSPRQILILVPWWLLRLQPGR